MEYIRLVTSKSWVSHDRYFNSLTIRFNVLTKEIDLHWYMKYKSYMFLYIEKVVYLFSFEINIMVLYKKKETFIYFTSHLRCWQISVIILENNSQNRSQIITFLFDDILYIFDWEILSIYFSCFFNVLKQEISIWSEET